MTVSYTKPKTKNFKTSDFHLNIFFWIMTPCWLPMCYLCCEGYFCLILQADLRNLIRIKLTKDGNKLPMNTASYR